MNCVVCDQKTKVVNSRSRPFKVWRRRTCNNNHLVSTYETLNLEVITVTKRSGANQPFNSSKLLLSLAASGLAPDETIAIHQTALEKIQDSLDSFDKPLSSKQIATVVHATLLQYRSVFAERYKSYSETI